MVTRAHGWRFAVVLAATAASLVAMVGLTRCVARAATAIAGSCAASPVPPGRVWGSWAYDPATRQIVLFGGDKTSGEDETGVVYDGTWTWTSDGGWVRRHVRSSPSPRTGAAMAYDYATGQMVLFGGSRRPGTTGGFNNQTWTWTGSSWAELHPATSPPPRHNADMVYDAASRELVLFGGYGGSYLNDTWAWTGSNWTRLHPATSPGPRDTESFAYDQATRSAILWSGWNGSTWVRLHPAAAPAWRKYGKMTYDGALHELVLFGGVGRSTRPGSVWGWTGSTWRQLEC